MFADAINESVRENDAIQKKQDIAASRVARSNTLFRLLDELPDEFTKEDLMKVLEDKKMVQRGYVTYLKRMEDRELIMPKGNGFKKIFKN